MSRDAAGLFRLTCAGAVAVPAERPDKTLALSQTINLEVGALVRAGLEALRAGDRDCAEAYYDAALRKEPNAPGALDLGGMIALARGDLDRAAKLTGRAVRAAPDRIDFRFRHAETLERAGRIKEALAAYAETLALAPDHLRANTRGARLHAESGDPKMALAFSRIALALAPSSPEALCARAQAFRKLRNLEDAEACYRAAIEHAPDDLPALTGYASLLSKMSRSGEAAKLYRRAAELSPGDSAVLTSLALTTELEGDTESALAIYDEALALASDDPEIIYRRASCVRDLGRFDEASEALNAAIAIDPSHGPSYLALARIKRLPDGSETRKRLTRIVGDPSRRPDDRIQAGFAFGEVLDRAGDPDAAFRRFAEANRLLAQERARRGEVFDRRELHAQALNIETCLAAEYAANGGRWGNSSELPVFVVGLPRSGTTLVEQICASHSRVAGVGELEALIPISRDLAKRNAGVDRLAEWDAAHARSLADEYVAELTRLGGDAARVVNKTPLNLLRLGLIGSLFPGARIIWCRRDLRDVVVSQHTMFFGEGNIYSTDQSDCAFAARQIERVGQAWRSTTALPVLEVVYEELVADLETHVRRIIDFLDLPWEPACLDFQNTARHVDTPSSWQVRQPIYSTSVGRWRRFEKHLAPMLAALAQPLDDLSTPANPA